MSYYSYLFILYYTRLGNLPSFGRGGGPFLFIIILFTPSSDTTFENYLLQFR